MAADTSRGASPVLRLAATGYDWVFDHVDGRASALPFPDATFDTVVASLELCAVPDPAGASCLAEAHRLDPPAPCLGRQVEVRQSGRFADITGERAQLDAWKSPVISSAARCAAPTDPPSLGRPPWPESRATGR